MANGIPFWDLLQLMSGYNATMGQGGGGGSQPTTGGSFEQGFGMPSAPASSGGGGMGYAPISGGNIGMGPIGGMMSAGSDIGYSMLMWPMMQMGITPQQMLAKTQYKYTRKGMGEKYKYEKRLLKKQLKQQWEMFMKQMAAQRQARYQQALAQIVRPMI